MADPTGHHRIQPRPNTWFSSKRFYIFSWGGYAPQIPPFKSAAVAASAGQIGTLKPSRLLSQPPWTAVMAAVMAAVMTAVMTTTAVMIAVIAAVSAAVIAVVIAAAIAAVITAVVTAVRPRP